MAAKLLLGTNGIGLPANINALPPDSVTGIITNGFFTVDKAWIVKSWNTAAEKLLRVPAKDIIGKNLWETFAGTLPLNFYSNYHETLLKDIPGHFKKYWPAMDTWFDVFTFYLDKSLSVSFRSSNPIQTEQPGPQLKVLNELYRFVTEVTSDSLWEWNLATKEVFWIDGGHKRMAIYGFPMVRHVGVSAHTLKPYATHDVGVHLSGTPAMGKENA